MLTLIEKAEAAYDVEQRERAEEIVRQGSFTFDDFLEQLQQVKKMGPLQGVIGMMPGLHKEVKNAQIEDGEIAKIEAIIRSMTIEERRNPTIVNGSRRLRIAQGSGTTTGDVNNLIKQFKQMQQMMRSMGIGGRNKKGKKGKNRRLPVLPGS